MVLKLVLGEMIVLEEGNGIEGVGEEELGLLGLGLLALLQRLRRSREGTHRVPVECGELRSEGPRRADNHARRVVDDDARSAAGAARSGTLTIWR